MSVRFVQPLLRARGGVDSGRVGFVELFYDLVFVFAITQLSHLLLAHLDLGGVLKATFLLVAVWWSWVYTAWALNWLNPDSAPVRLMLFALMFVGLLMSASIPEAFGARGFAFACAYAAMQVGRTAFALWCMHREAGEGRRRNFQRILAWLVLSAGFWIAGGLQADDARWGFWLVAMGLELLGPVLRFRTPGLGATPTSDWDVDGGHLAERCGLFVIIALGESLLVTGATFAGAAWSMETFPAFATAVLAAIAMWWIYFDTGAVRGHHRIAHSDDPGRVARVAYTYLHLLIVAGILLCAVGDELVLAHPGHATEAGIAVILGGPVAYLAGVGLFKWVTNTRRWPPASHVAGLLAFVALAPFAFGHAFGALQLAILSTAILVGVAIWENVALRSGAAGRAEGPDATGP